MTRDPDVPDATDAELSGYVWGNPLSPELRARLLDECEADRVTEDMREGRSDSGLYLAWLRS